jgi:hypothetical protein
MPAVGPVCHIPPKNIAGNPQPVDLPGIAGPASPNVQSLTQVVNNLRQVILVLAGQRGPQGVPGAPGQSANAAQSSFTQKDIQTQTVKIYQNNDPSTGNFVEVQQVTSLTMGAKNGATWTYKAPPGQNSGQ